MFGWYSENVQIVGSLCLTFIFLELDLLEVQTSQAMVGTSSRTIASSGKIWGQFGQRLFWEVDVASTEWQDISGLSVYLWFSVTNAIFSNMISTVCIYIYCCIHTDSSRVLQLRSGSTTTPCHQLGECGLGGSGFVSQLSIFWCKNYPHVMMTWKKRYHIRSTWGK